MKNHEDRAWGIPLIRVVKFSEMIPGQGAAGNGEDCKPASETVERWGE